MSNILVIGDSHCNQFKSSPGAIHFKNSVVFTAQRFVEENTELWEKLEPWMKTHKEKEYKLFLSVSEIDIRGHYWRHYPRNLHLTLDEFVRAICIELLKKIKSFMKKWNISRCVLWGPPPACQNTKYNSHWPFSGSVDVRNKIINVYNRNIVDLITLDMDNIISYATGFYDHVSEESYMPLDHCPTDGVHWHNNLTQKFWNELIMPCINGEKFAFNKDLFEKMKVHQYRLDYKQVESNDLYDTWQSTSSCSGDYCIRYNDESWEYKLIKDNKILKNYKELTLIKI